MKRILTNYNLPTKNITVLVLSSLLLLLLIPTQTIAELSGDYEYTDNNDGTCTITDYTGPGGDVIIPDTLAGLSVTTIGEGAFYWCSDLTSVTTPSSVTTIGDSAFAYCDNLTSVTIGNSVTTIGNRAFYGCIGLTNIIMPNSVTTIGDNAFCACNGLTSVTIGNGVTTIGINAFMFCRSLTCIAIPESVTIIGDEAFLSCSGLTSITVDELNSTFSSIDGVLLNKSQTVLIQYPLGKTGHYTIPGTVSIIGSEAFWGSKHLTSITIPDSVTTIGNKAFTSCLYLTSVTIPESVTTIGDAAFVAGFRLTSITVDELNPKFSSIDGVLFDKSQTLLIQYPGGKTGGYVIPHGVTVIGSEAFWGCNDLTGITIPDSMTTIGYEAFCGCRNLTSILLPDSVTLIGERAFVGCNGLTSITIPNSVEIIDNSAFAYSKNLTAIYFKGDPPSIGSDVFYEVHPNATVYYLPGASGWGATYGGLPTVVWPLSVADFDMNGDVDYFDFAVFATAWQSVEGQVHYNPLCDISDPVDGTVDGADMAEFADNWLINVATQTEDFTWSDNGDGTCTIKGYMVQTVM